MTQSLVPQVEQINGQQAREIAEANQGQTLTFEEALQYSSFRFGTGVNDFVVELWKNSEVISRSSLEVPYCMHSQNEDGSWNFSWGVDFPGQEVSTRSCFYTIFPNGSVKCREYPNELLSASTVGPALVIAVAVVSDVLQSHDWDKEVAIQALAQKLGLANS